MLLANIGGSLMMLFIGLVLSYVICLAGRAIFNDYPINRATARDQALHGHVAHPPTNLQLFLGTVGTAAEYLMITRMGRLVVLFVTIAITLYIASTGKISYLMALQDFFHYNPFSETSSVWSTQWAGANLLATIGFLGYLIGSMPKSASTNHGSH